MSVDLSKPLADSQNDAPIIGRYRELNSRWRTIMALSTGAATLLAINQIFAFGFFVGSVMLDSRYLYLITGIMLSMVFSPVLNP